MASRIKIIALVGLALATLLAWYFFNQDKGLPLTTTSPTIQDLTQTLEVSGSIRAHEHVKLTFPTGGLLTWVNINEGDWVNKWQGIAKIDTRQLEKQMQQDLNAFGQIFRTHDDTLDETNYYKDSGIDTQVKRIIERSQLGLDSAALQVEIRDLAVRLSTISSPISGIATRLDTPFAGVNIKPTDVFEIVNPESLYFSILVNEEDTPLVTKDQQVLITLDAFPNLKFTGTVSRISFSPSSRDPSKIVYETFIHVPEFQNTELNYKLGMQGLAQVILSQKNEVMSLPTESFIFRDGETFVEVLKTDGSIDTKPVTIGIETPDSIEVIDGLNLDDRVIVPER